MIENEVQYAITKEQTTKFELALKKFEENLYNKEQFHPLLYQAQRDALQSQFEDLQAQLKEYDERMHERIRQLEQEKGKGRVFGVSPGYYTGEGFIND